MAMPCQNPWCSEFARAGYRWCKTCLDSGPANLWYMLGYNSIERWLGPPLDSKHREAFEMGIADREAEDES